MADAREIPRIAVRDEIPSAVQLGYQTYRQVDLPTNRPVVALAWTMASVMSVIVPPVGVGVSLIGLVQGIRTRREAIDQHRHGDTTAVVAIVISSLMLLICGGLTAIMFAALWIG